MARAAPSPTFVGALWPACRPSSLPPFPPACLPTFLHPSLAAKCTEGATTHNSPPPSSLPAEGGEERKGGEKRNIWRGVEWAGEREEERKN